VKVIITREDSLRILDKCIEELKNMSQKEFDKKMLQQGSFFDEYSYEDNGFCLVLSDEYIPKQ